MGNAGCEREPAFALGEAGALYSLTKRFNNCVAALFIVSMGRFVYRVE